MPAREVFGPVLHLASYAGGALDDLCELINGAGFGLTLALHTRLPSVIERVTQRRRWGMSM